MAEQNLSLRDPPQAKNPASQDSIFNFLVLVFVPQGTILGGRAAFLLVKQAAHNYELAESDNTVLCIDYALDGIGSNSCGPVVSDEYRFSENEFRFDFALVPFVRG